MIVSFQVMGCRLWNSLPPEITSIEGDRRFVAALRRLYHERLVGAVSTCKQLLVGGVATGLALTFDWAGLPCQLPAVYRSPSSSLLQFVEGISGFCSSSIQDNVFRILTGGQLAGAIAPRGVTEVDDADYAVESVFTMIVVSSLEVFNVVKSLRERSVQGMIQ
ncbi:hypothetical protein J6590_065976 [Homalodisca vitripennis]|nr:hypothetical protein J6590_065976 [Homalodisca vitripennis]